MKNILDYTLVSRAAPFAGVACSGFADDGIAAFARGRATNIIDMTGQDLYFILSKSAKEYSIHSLRLGWR